MFQPPKGLRYMIFFAVQSRIGQVFRVVSGESSALLSQVQRGSRSTCWVDDTQGAQGGSNFAKS